MAIYLINCVVREENPVGNWTLYVIDGKNPKMKGKFLDWKLTLWGEVSQDFIQEDDEGHGNQDIGVDDFETQKDQSFLDREQEERSPILIYSLVGLFMTISVASTSFIVKRYMLNGGYTRTATNEEEESYEIDNLLTEHDDEDDD